MSAARWPMVALGEVLRRDETFVTELEDRPYKRLSVKLYGRGVVLDKPSDGSSIRMTRHQFARAGQVIVSEIWAKKGAIGIVPPEGEGALVTTHFFLFDIIESCISTGWIRWLLASNYLEPQLAPEARGTTGYASVRPAQFLAAQVPLPPLAEQERIVARLDAVAARVERRRKGGADLAKNLNALAVAAHLGARTTRPRRVADLLTLQEERCPVVAGQSYPQVGIRAYGLGLFAKPAMSSADTTYSHFNRLSEGQLVVSQVKGWEGAVAVCGPEHAGMFASPEYRTFVCKPGQLRPEYLRLLITTPWFLDRLTKLTRGQGARRERLRPEALLADEWPMPDVAEQAVLEGLIAKANRAIQASRVALDHWEALLPALLHEIFGAEVAPEERPARAAA